MVYIPECKQQLRKPLNSENRGINIT